MVFDIIERMDEEWNTDKVKGHHYSLDFLRRVFYAMTRDTVPYFERSGNFGTASESDTGFEQTKEHTFQPNAGEDLYVTGFGMVMRDNDENFDARLVSTFHIDGEERSREFYSWGDMAVIAENSSMMPDIAKIAGTTYHLFQAYGSYPTLPYTAGLHLDGDRGDYIKFESKESDNDSDTELDSPYVVIAIRGFILLKEFPLNNND